jgi:NAD(P)-dependent dehydrogenase (short-subunit alcohol dehydrogenase family)
MNLELHDRVAVVTGASKGIGLAVTRTLAQEGAKVVAASRTRTPDLEALGDRVLHVGVDLMDPDAPAEVIDRAVEAFGGLDILVNNAGGPPPGAPIPHSGFLERSDAEWEAVLAFNLLTAVRACRAALPVLREREGASIVNVSSAVGRQPQAFNIDYAAAKGAMTTLTKGLSEEFGPLGVRVNGVAPGPVLTPWWTEEGGAADAIAGMVGAERDAVMTTLAPEMMALTTGRLVDPQEIADAVVWLASPRSASTTGAEFVVDGGMLKAT